MLGTNSREREIEIEINGCKKTVYIHVFQAMNYHITQGLKLAKTLKTTLDLLNNGDTNTIKKFNENKLNFIFKNETTGQFYIDWNAVTQHVELDGIFASVSTYKLTTEEAYIAYQDRDNIEKFIKCSKGDLKLDTLRGHSLESIKGRMLIMFVSMSIMGYLRKQMGQLRSRETKTGKIFVEPALSSKYSFQQLILLFDNLNVWMWKNGNISFNEISKKQKQLASILDLTCFKNIPKWILESMSNNVSK